MWIYIKNYEIKHFHFLHFKFIFYIFNPEWAIIWAIGSNLFNRSTNSSPIRSHTHKDRKGRKTNAVLSVAYHLLDITSDKCNLLKNPNCQNDCKHQHPTVLGYIRHLTITVLHTLKLKFEAIKN